MKIALFNWRDLHHPKAGGAEVATHQLASELTKRGHEVTWFTSCFEGASTREVRDGYRVLRSGSEVTCRFHALRWLHKNRDVVDVAIDEVNTLPFLSRLILKDRVVVWMHQLAREVWISEAPVPIGHVGYVLEPALLAIYKNTPIVTISESSAASFRAFGLRGPVHVAEISLRPPAETSGEPVPGRIGYVGRIAPSKRIDHMIRALAIVSQTIAHAELVIVGAGGEQETSRLQKLARDLQVEGRVRFMGRLSSEERDAVMGSMDVFVMASQREGWGLVVSEAARYGVPSVVYPVAGLVDAVQNEVTGIVTDRQDPQELARGIQRMITDRALRERFGRAAMEYLYQFDNERFVGRFEKVLEGVARSSSYMS